MTQFSDLPLSDTLLQALRKQGFDAPTPIQAASLPLSLAGKDVVGLAKTGSGKTAAFGLPILQRLDLELREPQALILSPTRELAQQLTSSLRALGSTMDGLRVQPLTGGGSTRAQQQGLAAGAHILVATPGRLLRYLRQGRISTETLEVLVLDEADRMLDMGFEEEVLSITSELPVTRQTLLFSATWSDEVQRLAQTLTNDPETVGAVEQVEQLAQRAVECDWESRLDVLVTVLSELPVAPTLIFCETKAQCREVTAHLDSLGARALALHGDLEQRDRDDVMMQLRTAGTQLLVATNVAARGLDMEGLGAVICYELSPDPDVHLHRIGRTARAGRGGIAISLVASERQRRILRSFEDRFGPVPVEPITPNPDARLDAWNASHRTLVILGGRKDKLRPGDILGALTKDVGLNGDQVGTIVCTDQRTWVGVSASVARKAAAGLNKARIKKRRFRVLALR